MNLRDKQLVLAIALVFSSALLYPIGDKMGFPVLFFISVIGNTFGWLTIAHILFIAKNQCPDCYSKEHNLPLLGDKEGISAKEDKDNE